jgi:VWFA-related protein
MLAMVSRRRMLALLAASPALRTVLAAPQANFSTGVNVVSLLVTVRDKSGKFVNDLEQGDFVVEQDGQPQTISYFSRQYDLPLTLGLLVDFSLSQLSVIPEELEASARFFRQVLREGVDQAFLVAFAARPWLMQDVTSSRAELEASLATMRNGLSDPRSASGTVLFDAVAGASDQMMRRIEGRKALVLLTDGDDNRSTHTLDTAIASCQRSDTVVYSISLGEGLGLTAGLPILETLARRTGGGCFEVSRKQRVQAVYQIIDEELRSQYNIGYIPPPAVPGKSNSGFHKVGVTVKRSGITTHTRDGYYSGG